MLKPPDLRASLQFLIFATVIVSGLAANAAVYLSADELGRSVDYGAQSFFDPVGRLTVDRDGTPEWIGSAVLISENWLLTAGHVADEGSHFEFFAGANSSNPVAQRSVVETVLHPEWSPGTDGVGILFSPDFALMRLSTPIRSIEPAVRFRGDDTSDGLRASNDQIFAAGFGDFGWNVYDTNLVPLNDADGMRRGGTNRITHIREDIYLQVASYTFFPRDPVLDMEWKGSPGDSGGGWFKDVNGEIQLVGINSYAGVPWENPTFSGAGRVSLQNSWIDSVIAVPEPSVLPALAILGVLMGAQRRSRGAASHSSSKH